MPPEIFLWVCNNIKRFSYDYCSWHKRLVSLYIPHFPSLLAATEMVCRSRTGILYSENVVPKFTGDTVQLYSKVLSFKTGVGMNIALHALRTAEYPLSDYCLSGSFIFFFPFFSFQSYSSIKSRVPWSVSLTFANLWFNDLCFTLIWPPWLVGR